MWIIISGTTPFLFTLETDKESLLICPDRLAKTQQKKKDYVVETATENNSIQWVEQ